MKAVSQRTGLSPHVLRVWERRYGAVTPERSDTNRRLYTEDEIRRLGYLAQLCESGHTISHVAKLSTPELASLCTELPAQPRPAPSAPSRDAVDALLDEAWSCIEDMDSQSLHEVLDRAAVSLGLSTFSIRLIVPLVERVGHAWETGEISPAEEHSASAVIKEVLLAASRPYAQPSGAPNLTVATPAGQLHELGAVLVVALARRAGWNVSYLGASLPSSEIARAAISSDSRAVALSIVYPLDDPELGDELRSLRKVLPENIEILVGGRASTAYQQALEEISAQVPTSLESLAEELSRLRTKSN